MKKYTIIVTVYNLKNYVERCIKSVIAQTYGLWEALVLDDGSYDDSSKICDEYALLDNRVIIIHKKNQGVSAARNVALRAASGEYVTFIDGDDYYKENYLSEINGAEKKGVDLVTSKIQTLSSSGLSKEINGIANYYEITDSHEKMRFIFQDVFYKQVGWSVCTDIFKREIIELNSLEFCTSCNNFAEDIGFAVKFILCSKSVQEIEKAFYIYDRTREESMMNKSKGKYRFNDLNEVAFDVENCYKKVIFTDSSDDFSLIHFCFMDDQYKGMQWDGNSRNIPNEIKKIEKSKWYYGNCKALLKNYKRLRELQGETEAADSRALVRFCLHKCYLIYKVELWLGHHFG